MWTCPSCMAMPVSSARDLPELRRGGAPRSLAARAEELNRHFARCPRFFEDEGELVHWPGGLLYEIRDRAVRRSCWPINLSVLPGPAAVAIAMAMRWPRAG